MTAKYVDIYAEMVAAGVPVDNHESDLYALATPEALRIVKESGWNYTTFVSQVDGKMWLDIAFGFRPWWDKRAAK